MTNMHLTGNAHYDARLMENQNLWIFGQKPLEEMGQRKKRKIISGLRHSIITLGGGPPSRFVEPRSRWLAGIAGVSLFMLGFASLISTLGLSLPWYAPLPLIVALAGEVLIIVSLIPKVG